MLVFILNLSHNQVIKLPKRSNQNGKIKEKGRQS